MFEYMGAREKRLCADCLRNVAHSYALDFRALFLAAAAIKLIRKAIAKRMEKCQFGRVSKPYSCILR